MATKKYLDLDGVSQLKTKMDNLYVTQVSGKGLSTNDFTNALKNKVNANTTARHTHDNASVLDAISSSDITNWNGKGNIWSGTQAQYDAIVTKDTNTLYCIVE